MNKLRKREPPGGGQLSKKRNKHLQTMLIEAANLAPRWNPHLAVVHEKEMLRGNRNQTAIAVPASWWDACWP